MLFREPLLKRDPCPRKWLGGGLLLAGLFMFATSTYFGVAYGNGDWEAAHFNRYEYFEDRAGDLTWTDPPTGENLVTSTFGILNMWLLGLTSLVSGCGILWILPGRKRPMSAGLAIFAGLWLMFVTMVYVLCAGRAFSL